MSSRPVNFNDGSSKVIFSVVKNVDTGGANNGPMMFPGIFTAPAGGMRDGGGGGQVIIIRN